MNENLLALVQQTLGGDFSRHLGEFLGEPQGSTQSALDLLLPAVIGGIAQEGATPRDAALLMSLVDAADLDVGALGNVAGLFGGGGAGVNILMESSGGNLVFDLFGDKGGALASKLASGSGIKTDSATDMVAIVLPMVLTFLKKFIGEHGLDASSLSSLLAAQGPLLKNSLDHRLAEALDLPSPGAPPGGPGNPVAGAVGGAPGGGGVAAHTREKSGQSRWLPVVIAAALVFMVWNLWTDRSGQAPGFEPSVSSAPPPKSVPELEPEPSAVSTGQPVNIYFDVGEAALGADGYSTIAAVATMINRAGLTVAVTGYTDTNGDLALNEELAGNRARAVVDALKAEGVLESSIQMLPPIFAEAGATDAEARRVEITLQ